VYTKITVTIQEQLATFDYIVGADECGRGCWAGPLVTCAVVIPKEWPFIADVCDSKAFTGDQAEPRRAAIARKILPTTIYSLVNVPSKEVDSRGVHKANIEALSRALTQVIAKHIALGCNGTYGVVVDGTMTVTYELRGEKLTALFLPQADVLIPAVSAASIIGKVARDAHMRKIADKFPGYGFENHKGYGTKEHKAALEKLGACELHRQSFGPIRDLRKRLEEGEPPDMRSLFTEDES
jgi:ribonuclease HII